jgi:hypothetical protein
MSPDTGTCDCCLGTLSGEIVEPYDGVIMHKNWCVGEALGFFRQ